MVHISIQFVIKQFIGSACAFLLNKNQCLGFWIKNRMGKCYCCSLFSCTQMGESDGKMEKMIMKVTVCWILWCDAQAFPSQSWTDSCLEQPHTTPSDLWPIIVKRTWNLFFLKVVLLQNNAAKVSIQGCLRLAFPSKEKHWHGFFCLKCLWNLDHLFLNHLLI